MSNESTKRNTILFVDDDQEYLDTLRSLFSVWSNGEWEIRGATSASKAMAVLQESPVDLVVTDLQMPVVDGLQLLALLNRKYPNTPKAVLTSRTDSAARDSCMQAGADLFLTKPTNIDLMEEVFAALKELVGIQAKGGFRGVMRRVELQELIQLECLGNKSSILEISAGNVSGQIFICEGRIVHAVMGGREGLEAFNRILSLVSGEFGLKPFVEPPVETISGSWEMLIMEAARQRDEGQHSADGPVPTAEEKAETDAKDAAAEAAIDLPDFHAPSVEEILVCTTKGEVVYEWQSPNADARIELIAFIKKWTQQLNRKLPLGRMRDAEFVTGTRRLAFKLTDEWTLVAQVNHGAATAPHTDQP